MKVILLKDVPRIGRKFEVKDVPDGHAQNFLFPRKLAERATPVAIARLEAEKKNIAAAGESARDAVKKIASVLREVTVSVAAEANDQGGLFRAVHANEIAHALTQLGHSIPEEQILIETPIKTTGTHEVTLSVGGVEEKIHITVTKK